MANSKKYDYRIVQDDENWTAEITRRASSKKTVVSKSQGGFSSEPDAKAWAENELVTFLKSHDARNKRHAEKRAQAENTKREKEENNHDE